MLRRLSLIALHFGLASAWVLFAAGGASAQSPVAAQPDLAKLGDEAQAWLIDLVKTNTVNPPGNEGVTAKYIAAIFQKEGISNEVIEIAPGRSIVIARLQAGPLPDSALMIAAAASRTKTRSAWTRKNGQWTRSAR